ncbi:helix-turn-helix transcriptional regulator [Saccharopolyspora hirsuta]|uniref:helix-turn-helix domain-containing protein n=1 Tax=Saccharopolyspora hirsuta TaxID=1837 RepID=UPI003334627E
MTTTQVGAAVDRAREAAGLSQRGLADRTGISQTTLSRIISGERAAKMPEIIRIADATGYTVAQLTGTATAERVQYAARASNGSDMEKMRQQLLDFIELDAHLDDQAVPAPQ